MNTLKEPQYKIILKGANGAIYDLIPESVYDLTNPNEVKKITEIKELQKNDKSDTSGLNPMLLSFGLPINAILFGGSRMLNLNDIDGDYDLNIILDEYDFEYIDKIISNLSIPLRYIEYNNKTVHGYFSSASKLKSDNSYYEYHKNFGIIEACYGLLDNSKIILLDNIKSFKTFYNTLCNLKQQAIIECKNKYYSEIKQLCDEPLDNLKVNISKEIYHLCVISCLLTQQSLQKIIY